MALIIREKKFEAKNLQKDLRINLRARREIYFHIIIMRRYQLKLFSLLTKQRITFISMTSSYMSSSIVLVFIEIFDDSLTTLVPRNHVTSGLGFALHLHFMVISVPVSFGMMRGFSMKDGAQPAPSSASWKDPRLDIVGDGTSVVSGMPETRATPRPRVTADDPRPRLPMTLVVLLAAQWVMKRRYRDFTNVLVCAADAYLTNRPDRPIANDREKSLVHLYSAFIELYYGNV